MAVEKNSYANDQLRDPAAPKVRFVLTGTTHEALDSVARGEADYAVLAAPVADRLIAQNRLPLHRTGAPLWPRDYVFAVRKDRPELAAWVNANLDRVIDDGDFESIFEHWRDGLDSGAVTSGEVQPPLALLLVALAIGALVAGYALARGRGRVFGTGERERRTASERRAMFLARHDRETGLPNRDNFVDTASAIAVRADEVQQFEVFALKVLNLKDIERQHGRRATARVIQHIAERLRAENIVAGRTMGSTFAVLVDISASQALFDKLGAPITIRRRVRSTPEIAWGAARAPEHSTDAEDLMHKAEVALSACIQRRRNWLLYDPSLEPNAGDLQLVRDFRASGRESLIALFQPQLDLKKGRIVAAEALMRWRHPKRGLVPPAEIIPLLESAGLMASVTQTMIDEAVRQSVRFRKEGLPCGFSINISISDVIERDLAAEFASAFERHGANPSDITAELTESGTAENPERVRRVLEQLKALGMGTAIDDYGTGFSSLASLADLPFNELKIDQLFVRQMLDSAAYRSIVLSTVRMAHDLGLSVVAEGAEDGPTVSALAAIGCDRVQGYAISHPLPADDLLRLVSGFAWREWRPAQQVAEISRRRSA